MVRGPAAGRGCARLGSDKFQAIFDRIGKETDEIAYPRIIQDGKAYAEVRIPEGYAAAIVRE